jgi:ATP-dependent DNA ligase
MKARQLIDGASFGPETVKAMGEAFDQAWAEVAGNFGDNPSQIASARLRLADAVISVTTEGSTDVDVWAFDLLAMNSKDLRKWSLEARQARLQALVSRFDCPVLLHSEAFDDGEALLRVAEKHGLEGVVSKRRDAP